MDTFLFLPVHECGGWVNLYNSGTRFLLLLFVLSCFSCDWLFGTPWTIAHQAPLSLGFSRQEYWSGLPFPPPEDLPDSGIEPRSLRSPALADEFNQVFPLTSGRQLFSSTPNPMGAKLSLPSIRAYGELPTPPQWQTSFVYVRKRFGKAPDIAPFHR